MVVGRQILIQQQNYISMWLALQLSHNDVLGVGLGWVLGLGGPESLPLASTCSKEAIPPRLHRHVLETIHLHFAYCSSSASLTALAHFRFVHEAIRNWIT